ncbi:MAG: Xaa-Pro aminopeptidase [Euryarchaeota archaeon]|nr:Xaa-Pro aminopeptidase [Euryarchaeota archaeon]
MALPFDNSEYILRQNIFLSKLSGSCTVIIPTNDQSVRSNDVKYPFRACSYMLYLCGWAEEAGVFVASNTTGDWETTLFVSPRDTSKEIWEGKRVGVEGAKNWPVDKVDSLDNLENSLESLVGLSENTFYYNGSSQRIDKFTSDIGPVKDPRPLINEMRMIKSPGEIELMRESSEIASLAHIEAMKSAYPKMGEWHVQSTIEASFKSSRSQWSFPTIVGGGENGTILHYNSNDSIIRDGMLVLVDAGCEVHGYASDITRTWPVNGSFSDPQREIYQLVLNSQISAIEACIPGSSWISMHRAASTVLAEGLIDLGILNCSIDDAIGDPEQFDGKFRDYFMHGTGHLLGLDVHDVGGGRQGDVDPGPTLQPGMVVTVEPGLYFGSWRSDIIVPERYSGIGIRIEDDILITETAPVVISSTCPKAVEDIESIVGKGV